MFLEGRLSRAPSAPLVPWWLSKIGCYSTQSMQILTFPPHPLIALYYTSDLEMEARSQEGWGLELFYSAEQGIQSWDALAHWIFPGASGDAILNFLHSFLCRWVYVCLCLSCTLTIARGKAGDNNTRNLSFWRKEVWLKLSVWFSKYIFYSPFLLKSFYFPTDHLPWKLYMKLASWSKGINITQLLEKPIKKENPD